MKNIMTQAQVEALVGLCERYGVPMRYEHYHTGGLGLPTGWFEGWIGGPEHQKLYVGVSPEGQISS